MRSELVHLILIQTEANSTHRQMHFPWNSCFPVLLPLYGMLSCTLTSESHCVVFKSVFFLAMADWWWHQPGSRSSPEGPASYRVGALTDKIKDSSPVFTHFWTVFLSWGCQMSSLTPEFSSAEGRSPLLEAGLLTFKAGDLQHVVRAVKP